MRSNTGNDDDDEHHDDDDHHHHDNTLFSLTFGSIRRIFDNNMGYVHVHIYSYVG
jgi:hypothetical protein